MPDAEDAEKRDLIWEALKTELVSTVVSLEAVGGLATLEIGGPASFLGGTDAGEVKDRADP